MREQPFKGQGDRCLLRRVKNRAIYYPQMSGVERKSQDQYLLIKIPL